MRNGNPEIRELWEIARLMEHGWRPAREFDGHVLVERIYKMGGNGVFALAVTRPAVSDERKLHRREYRRLLSDRHAIESGLAQPGADRKSR